MNGEVFPKSEYSPELSLSSLAVYSRFRRHPGFSKDDISLIDEVIIKKSISLSGSGFFIASGSVVQALGVINPTPWESDFFGLPMGRLHCYVADSVSDADLDCLVGAALRQAVVVDGVQHVSIDVDIDDYRVLNSLLRNGFEILDLKRTYFTNRLSAGSDYERFSGAVRGYCLSDADAVNAIIESTHFDTRFTRDRFLDAQKSARLYRDWFSRLISDAGHSSQVVVFERQGRVVGCGGIGEMDFSSYGLDRKMRTGSLYACSSDGVGGYGPVLYCLTRDALLSHGLVETTVSLNNAAAVRVVEGVRPNRSVTSYALRYFKQSN